MGARAAGIFDVLGRNAVHPFPARMAPGLALRSLERLKRRSVVLDPMAGSGTVLAMARANGHHGIGYDIDPLGVLISSVWTRSIKIEEFQHQANKVLARAKVIASDLPFRDAYPKNSDDETKSFVRYWFDDYSRRQLAAIAFAIESVRASDIKDALWCAFSRMIIAKKAGVSLAMDLSHSRPHRSFDYAPRKPFRVFLDAVSRVSDGCIRHDARNRGPVTKVQLGDVRKMPLASRSVDLVFTSPPYLNAIDYLRCSKFSLVWMGYSTTQLRDIRRTSIGAEIMFDSNETFDGVIEHLHLQPSLPPRMNDILRRYIDDSSRALKEVARVLAPQGKAVYVVGENTIKGTYVPTGKLISYLASNAGLRLAHKHYRNLPANRRYLPPPGKAGADLDARMRREVILTFERD
jgi:hypothetical protein